MNFIILILMALKNFPGCKTIDLPENYGKVIYIYTTLDDLKKGAVFYG